MTNFQCFQRVTAIRLKNHKYGVTIKSLRYRDYVRNEVYLMRVIVVLVLRPRAWVHRIPP